ncbi:MAG: DUF4465 domain-containing protein [Crocinitomicaceae bacterium]
MKKFLLIVGLTTTFCANSQTQWWLGDFESPVLGPDSAWYGQDQVIDGDTTFQSGSFTFELNYNSSWDTFSGFSISSETDNVTPGYTNQFSAITGSGYNGSDQYSVCYASSFANNRVFLPDGMWFTNFYVTNTAYAYYSMLYGDSFAKPFGADTNAQGQIDGTNGEDWFLLTVYGLDLDTLYTGDSVNVYLADYTFPEDSNDYILDTWKFVDLGNFSMNTIGLDFVLSSSDTSGGFGMNTPAYFAVDNFDGGAEGIFEKEIAEILPYPNPTTGDVQIPTPVGAQLELYDMNGRLVKSEIASSTKTSWNIGGLDKGIYLLKSNLNGNLHQAKVILQ